MINLLVGVSFLLSLFVAIAIGVSSRIDVKTKIKLGVYLGGVMLWIGSIWLCLRMPAEILYLPGDINFFIGQLAFLGANIAFYFQYFFVRTYKNEKFSFGLYDLLNFSFFVVCCVAVLVPGAVLESMKIPASLTHLEMYKSQWVLLYVFYILYFYFLTVGTLFYRMKGTQNLILKEQFRCLLFASAFFWGSAIITNLILASVFERPELNSIGPIFYLVEAGVYFYAVSRYRFLNLEHLWPFSDSTVTQLGRLKSSFKNSVSEAINKLVATLDLGGAELVLVGDARYNQLGALTKYAETYQSELVRAELDYQLTENRNHNPKLKRISAEMKKFMIVAMLPVRNGDELIGVLLLEQKMDRLFSVQEISTLKRVLSESTYLITRERDYQKTITQLSKGNNETQRELFKDLLHEVRQPLTLARNIPELIDWGRLKPEDQKHLKKSQQSLQELSGKLEKISEAFQWSQSAIPLQKTRGTLAELREYIRQDMLKEDPKWFEKMDFKWEQNKLENDLFYYDMVQLKRVFVELGKNALFFRGEKPLKLKVRAFEDGADIVAHYSDNGIGIAPENWEKIFDLMFVVAESRNEKESGLGLGLTISRGIVQAHGGSIKVLSSTKNKGTTFEIRVPLERSK